MIQSQEFPVSIVNHTSRTYAFGVIPVETGIQNVQ